MYQGCPFRFIFKKESLCILFIPSIFNNVKVIAVAGYVGEGIDTLYEGGINAIFGILPKASSLEEALAEGPQNVERTCENIARLIQLNEKKDISVYQLPIKPF